MVSKRGGFVIQRHNELRDLEAELLRTVCSDVEIEPVLQDINGERLNRGANKAPYARLDIHARGLWETQRSAFFDVRVCHPNAESYKDLEPQQIHRLHKKEKKRKYSSSFLDIEHGTFTPPSIYNNRWNGPRMFEVPQSPCRTDSIEERGTVCQDHLLDQSKNIICSIKICPHLLERLQNNKKSPMRCQEWRLWHRVCRAGNHLLTACF